MNRVMTAGLDQRWRRLAAAAVVRPGDRVLDACCGTGDLALAAEREGGVVTGLDFSEAMLERARRKSRVGRVGAGRHARAAVRATAPSTPSRSASACATSTTSRRARASCAGCCDRAAGWRCSRSRSRAALLRPFFRSGSTGSCRCSARVLPGGAGLHVPARRACGGFPAPEELAAALGRERLRATCGSALLGRHDRRAPHRRWRRDHAQALLARRGSTATSTEVEERLPSPVASHPGLVARRRRATRSPPVASGCDRCSSFLVGDDRERAVARRRRGRARAHGDARPRRPDRRRADASWAAGRLDEHGAGRRARPATTSSRAPSPSWRRRATSRACGSSARRASRSPAARRCSGGSGTSRHDGRRLPGADAR